MEPAPPRFPTGDAPGMDSSPPRLPPVPAAERLTAADELTTLVLDRLGPAVVAYRREVARRVGLAPDELLCVDQLRRLGPLPSSRLGAWIGVTRGALSKILRRLEDAGHLERRLPRRRGQEVEVAWRPHPDRDATLSILRARVRRDMADLVGTYRLDDPERRALVAWWATQAVDVLARHARRLADDAAYARLLDRRRREHAAEVAVRR